MHICNNGDSERESGYRRDRLNMVICAGRGDDYEFMYQLLVSELNVNLLSGPITNDAEKPFIATTCIRWLFIATYISSEIALMYVHYMQYKC